VIEALPRGAEDAPQAFGRTVTMILTVVRQLSRWMPRTETVDAPNEAWADSDSSCHNSSYELTQGLEVIEHFEHFADTLPAFHAAHGGR
jgi:hypothetical protein